MIINLLVFIVTGAVAGWLAATLAKGRGFGPAGNIILGVVGSLLGGFLSNSGDRLLIYKSRSERAGQQFMCFWLFIDCLGAKTGQGLKPANNRGVTLKKYPNSSLSGLCGTEKTVLASSHERTERKTQASNRSGAL